MGKKESMAITVCIPLGKERKLGKEKSETIYSSH
jgi:hypothetical protein